MRAFSVNSRRRMHPALVTRVTRQQNGVRVEATLEARVLGVATRYLMEIVTEFHLTAVRQIKRTSGQCTAS